MLLDYKEIKKKYGLNVRGVLHIGAHFGQEYESYVANNVENMAFFEPLSLTYAILKSRIPVTEKVKLFNVALGSREGIVEMFVETANHGQSSSILEPDIHLKQYPHIIFSKRESVNMRTLDSFGESGELDLDGYNMINMDVQGYELEVLKGARASLQSVDYIFSEVNRASVYKGCAQVEEMDEFLAPYGFERVATSWEGVTWGDAFYMKRREV